MHIDIENGIFKIDNIILHRELQLKEFLDLYSKDIEQECSGGEGFLNYLLKPQICNNKYAIMRVYFNPSKLIDMFIVSFNEIEDFPKWEDYSERKMLKEKKINDNILLKICGKPPYEYKWGRISSVYDTRGGSSYIAIRFIGQ